VWLLPRKWLQQFRKDIDVCESDTVSEVKENDDDSLELYYEAFDFQMTDEDSREDYLEDTSGCDVIPTTENPRKRKRKS